MGFYKGRKNRKYCRFCKKENVFLHKSSKSLIGYQYYACPKCDKERMRKYYKTKNGKIAVNKSSTNYAKRNPEKHLAWYKARQLKSKKCEICKTEKTHKHHPDYTKPLEVVYLCAFHHVQLHKNLIK